MNRQVRLAALATATLAAGTGFASGQSPPSAVPAGSTANSGPVYVMKTAGQPERRVQVVKSEAQPDGSILTDVKDLASGTVYTLTNPSFLGKPVVTGAGTPTVAPEVKPAPAPIVTRPQLAADPNSARPLFGQFPNQRTAAQVPRERLVPADQVHPSTLPHARDRKADPLLAGASPAAIAARTPFKVVPAETPSVMGKVFGDPMKNQPAPRVGVLPSTPPAPKAVASLPKSTPGVTVVMPNIAPASVPKLEKAVAVAPPSVPVVAPVPAPTVVPAGIAIPPIDANARPSAATGLFDSQSSGVAVALPPIIEPNTTPPAVQPATPPVAIAPAPEPAKIAVEVPPVAVPMVAVPVPEVAVPEVAVPTVVAEPVVSTELPKDVRLMIEDVKNHKRPSFRMESATSLAESQYAKHPACIEALVHTATNDKAGVVRGHCIARLADLGYSEATFLKSLDTWSSDQEPAVQRAAVAAKAKLAGR